MNYIEGYGYRNHGKLSRFWSGMSIPCVQIEMNTGNTTSTRNLNWRVFPILITLCKVCSIFSFYGFLRFFNSLPKWLWPLQWSSPVSQSQAIPEEAGEGRETSRTGERTTHGWAMWRLNPKQTLDLTRLDRLTDRMNKAKVQVSNSLNRSALQHSAASGRHIQHQTRPAFLQEDILWHVNRLIMFDISLLSSFTRTNVFNFYMIAYPAWNAGSPRDASGHRRACSGGGVRNGFGRWKMGWPPKKIQTWVKPSVKLLNQPMLRKRGDHQEKNLW